jgi:phospholipid/cholesterol/gamma-HCH transport system ATP-binding protein
MTMSGNAAPIESLRFSDVSFHYEKTQPLFADLTIELPPNENVLVIGPSGAGKSVFLKLLAGLLTPVTGLYEINDVNVGDMSFEEFLPFRKRIGYSFDLGGLLANRTIKDNLMLPLLYHNEMSFAEAEARVNELMSLFGIASSQDRRPAAVSGAVRKACNLARAFTLEPEMLILDDPFVGLDREIISNLLKLIERKRSAGRLRHVFFSSRGERVSYTLATCVLQIESCGLKRDELHLETERKAAGG